MPIKKYEKVMARLNKRSHKEELKLKRKAEKLNKEIDLFQRHCFTGDRYYKEGAYEKAIKEWKAAKRISIGAGYPYDRLPKAYRNLATNSFK